MKVLTTFVLAVCLFPGLGLGLRRHHKLKISENEPKDEMNDLETNLVDSDEDDPKEEFEDPCTKKHCGAGQVCQIDPLGEPFCDCVKECPEEIEPRRKVCSNHNTTWPSDCALYQMRCWCKKGNPKCDGTDPTKENYRHMHIDYYGECRTIEQCSEGQMADFPRRMRDWLFNIMRVMAEKDELSPHYLKMEREAEQNMTRRWSNAVIWKWCDLDQSHDRAVSRHELFPIRAPLLALEHCIAPFLNKCDANNDHMISLKEWAKCMELDEDDIEDKCEDIREHEDSEKV